MEFKKDDVIYWLPKKEIKYIRYGSEMIFVTADPEEPEKLRYFFLKDEGKTVLFYGKRISHQPMVYPRGYVAAIPERFMPEKNDIYIRKENFPPRKISTLRDLKVVFAGDDAALGFIKSQRVKPDNIEDLHKLVSYTNNR
jgi:hypothetical protein